MANIEKVKVLVLGDSGVGKTSLTRLIAHNEPISNPLWTVGCSVEVKLHEYREGTPTQKTYFVELWDIGGSRSHRNTRSVFYNPFHGIIFVHDLTNRKSLQNLKKWLAEVMSKEGGKGKPVYDEFDTEQFVGSSMLPMIVIGTKLDQACKIRLQSKQSCDIAQDWGADSIDMNCMDPRSLAPGSSSAVKLSRFFDKVIEMRYYKKDYVAPTSNHSDKRRFPVPLSNLFMATETADSPLQKLTDISNGLKQILRICTSIQ
uniref:Rab-like protein 3 n=1 Tax=Lygus hesperus TaxID=30085 RepID=A0A0K8SJ95_LYGHE